MWNSEGATLPVAHIIGSDVGDQRIGRWRRGWCWNGSERREDRHDIVSGFPVRQIIIWQRNGGINFNKGYFLPTYEVIYLIAKPAFQLLPQANAVGDVWRIPQEKKNPHPAPFPVELATRCIESVGDGTVLDPFLGSGSTALAAETLERPWIGIDLSQKYCNMSTKRIERATGRIVSRTTHSGNLAE